MGCSGWGGRSREGKGSGKGNEGKTGFQGCILDWHGLGFVGRREWGLSLAGCEENGRVSRDVHDEGLPA